MKVECITHKNIKDYLISERYRNSEVLPISRHRGISHFQNPKAQSEDVLLINIYDDEKLVAYLGLLPDDIFFDEKKVHVGWLSCMWVAPSSRGKGLAKKLLKTAWENWNNNLIVTEFTPEAEGLYKRTGYFESLTFRNGIKCYHRLNLAEFLPKKNKNWNHVRFLLQIGDSIFNSIFSLKNRIFRGRLTQDIIVKQVDKIDEEILTFIQPFQKSAFTKKTKEDFDWQANFPWIINSVEAREDQKRYYFSSFAKRFKIVYLKFFKEEKLIGFLILTIRDNALRIPFVYFDEKNDAIARGITAHILNFMTVEKLNTIHISNKVLTENILSEKHNFFLIRKMNKECFISNKIMENVPHHSVNLQDGDGDAAFT